MSMSPLEVETILKFLMSKLPEDQLAELDGQLTGSAETMASDAALKRRQWLDIGPRARVAGRKQRLDRRPATDAATEVAFPHMHRLG